MARRSKLKVFSLGGLDEIGKNMQVIEYMNDILIIDSGVAFPDAEMLGIDLVIPDFTYLIQNKHKVKGLVLTHGHEDHIGSIPYLLKELNIPVYGTKLTLGLVEVRLKEHRMLNKVKRICVNAGNTINVGRFKVEFIATTHSLADSCALAIETPVGTIVHSGDFKVDHTPISGKGIDLQRFAELGKEGVLLFMCESTNIEVPGYSGSEKTVGKMFDSVFSDTPNDRIIVATFSSNIYRIQQIVNTAVKYRRKVAFMGRSMLNVVKTAVDLGFLQIPEDVLIEVNDFKKYRDNQIVLITTGSQGEPMSALTRMARMEHRQVRVKTGDKIVISASSIPGNEQSVYNVINGLTKLGADVVYEGTMDIHVSGHACQEEIKLLHALVRPKFVMPCHGEYRHLRLHQQLLENMGMKKDNVFVMDIGEVLELTKNTAKIAGQVPSGQVLVDGLGIGDVGNIVLRDRKHLAEDGIIIVVLTVEQRSGKMVAGPDIVSRGFVYVRESGDLMDEARQVAERAIEKCMQKNIRDWHQIKLEIRNGLQEFVWDETKRRPMILPIIMHVDGRSKK